ncbi:MAG: hypothetical protein Q8S58_01345 [Bosea sp. (in: a-proteobacteria)]|uniref:hypothetical protein n=1 Tax=Bosea sp. (in: a-proteobacteria) TaxID=1871050 RepID=UPI002735BE26|nr:hypothetical protein [Bosea sp. (in: a-proteobacteria)]MDP3255387.1 hypothetical protein [Bosea sp. (in: a-proteobacteria)]MDP3317748.1 hypothetical protein [Bosea sp. (in: a-proteobacteria)]
MKRERLRSRFRITGPLATVLLLSGCAGDFGAGIAELPAAQGWERLPIGGWVLNDGIEARTMVVCPREACAQQGFASVLVFSGAEAGRMEQALKADPQRLARLFSKPPSDPARKPAAPKPAAGKADSRPKSTTRVSRFEAEGTSGLLVEIRALDASTKSAATAILHGREGDRLVLAIAVSPDAGSARRDAVAAWRSR